MNCTLTPGVKLSRTTFETSRRLDFCSRKSNFACSKSTTEGDE